MFADRIDAGRKLATKLAEYRAAPDTTVLGIPRGGVIVAAEVADALGLPLDVAVAAKIGAPGNPEYAIGAVAADGEVTPSPFAGYSEVEVHRHAGAAFEKVRAQLAMWQGDRPPLRIEGRTVLLVDDGLATGLTARATADWLRRQRAGKIVLAVPVAPPESVRSLLDHADEVVVVETPTHFSAVGQFYYSFGQTTDAEVREALEAHRR
jgi:predicted phosphoribosyltransferase